MEKKLLNFIQQNSPDGGFLQSVYWRRFQEKYGRKTHTISISGESDEPVMFSNIIEQSLPIVGRYFYLPRGPIFEKSQIPNPNIQINPKSQIPIFFDKLIDLGKQNKVGWIRIEPNSEKDLEIIRNCAEGSGNKLKIVKSAVDMQPREILILDISKSEEEILAAMKQKTRYNIRISQKKGVKISNIQYPISKKDIEEFLRLVKITAKRDKITSHPENYYRKMFETIPPEVLKLYVAEYEGKVIAANLVLFFGKTATYMHGASDNIHREVMAPYLLQWRQILDAKKAGCERYDFGGVKIEDTSGRSWTGVTRFKTGFAPNLEPIAFPGCWDIILNRGKYNFYRTLQKIKKIFL
ncbi:MAG: hypothetical protein A3J76_02230 [Candidatus Moranbacteria bacterium RBG_13_45_13]|nr:MAG: hypothetical protein A3J76_02230 [Candidatus Moranbacteria bacterium RBG_13_45_13]